MKFTAERLFEIAEEEYTAAGLDTSPMVRMNGRITAH